jgi:cytochrome b
VGVGRQDGQDALRVAQGREQKPEPEKAQASLVRMWLWDWPIRIFHWTLVLAVSGAVVSANLGGEWMVWHGRAGLLVLGLLVFRLIWGLFGSSHARFARFFPTPARLLAYWRGQWQDVGHNPMSGVAIMLMLLLLGWQAGTGLFSTDDIDFYGPLFALVDERLAKWLTGWHHRTGDWLLGIIGLHVAAILYYRIVKKDNLLGPMLTGWKYLTAQQAESVAGQPSQPGSRLALMIGIGLALALVLILVLPKW